MIRDDILALCEAAGLTGTDASTAIATYIYRVPLTPAELSFLSQRTEEARASYFADNYGSDAARVATVVYQESTK